jgi:regulator of nucleoside diphosphate kinase
MNTTPSIIVSSLDAERLHRLLDAKQYSNLPGVDALINELDRAKVVEPAAVPSDVVTMNSTVQFVDDTTSKEYRLTLVYPGNTESPETVSILAPIGSALLGLSVGQSIDWQVPGGRMLKLRVLQVVRQPEAQGEFHR